MPQAVPSLYRAKNRSDQKALELGQSARNHGPLPISAGQRSFSKEHFPYRISEDRQDEVECGC
jgi:hypothetical protein